MSRTITATYDIGDNIQFYTENRCFKIKSPIKEEDWSSSISYYTKSANKYNLITTETEFKNNINNNINIYIEVGTQQIDCQCKNENHSGVVTVNNRQYTCPACKGKGVLITAVGENGNGCKITGISIFLPETGPIQEKYRVTPPGSVASILVAKEDILNKVSS